MQKLLFRKLLFLPDVFSIKEMPKIDSQKKFNEKLGIKKGYILISALGRLDSKKNIEIFLISLSKISTFLKMHNVKIFLGGLTDKTIMKRNMESIKILKKNKILIISNKFISNKNFFSALQYSNAIWCVQNKFFGSSGVFTRAISIGSIPIVNSISTLGALCLKENFGYTISFKEDISEQIKKLIIFLETTKEVNLSKKRAFLWSKKCSQEKFIDILLKSFN